MNKLIEIGLVEEEVNMLIGSVDHRLWYLDQEYHFYNQEPDPKYYQLIDLRDFLLSLIDK